MLRLNKVLRAVLLGILFWGIATVYAGPVVADTRVALVLGNGTYPSGPLGSPAKDKEAVAAKLRGLGFAVTEKLDLKREELLDAVRGFGEQLRQQPGAVALFYYSGHGMSVNNQNYIIPIDANIHSEPDVELYAVSVENVIMRMTTAQDRANIIILDACRDNPFEKRWKSSSGGLTPINEQPAGTLVAYAAAPGHVAEAGLNGNLSKYTESLVALIDQPNPLIATFQAVQNEVYRNTQGRQRPYVEISPGLPDFFFSDHPQSNNEESLSAVPSSPVPRILTSYNPDSNSSRQQWRDKYFKPITEGTWHVFVSSVQMSADDAEGSAKAKALILAKKEEWEKKYSNVAFRPLATVNLSRGNPTWSLTIGHGLNDATSQELTRWARANIASDAYRQSAAEDFGDDGK